LREKHLPMHTANVGFRTFCASCARRQTAFLPEKSI
jgi:hypothetical protein